jgi:uncharacterized membrane protein
MQSTGGLPAVNPISAAAPFRWLAGGWSDLGKAPLPNLAYGFAMFLISVSLVYALVVSNLAFWVWALICGFVFMAPMLAMGLYEAGRKIEQGARPRLADMVFVKSAFRQDLAYLGLALLFIFMVWASIAQITYGLSTHRLYKTFGEFATFALQTPEGHSMMTAGTVLGGLIAFVAYCLVVLSAPMLLDRDTNVFVAMATSVCAVTRNPAPMALWAAMIVGLLLLTALTGFFAMIVVFPWLGLASWRAYREIVAR